MTAFTRYNRLLRLAALLLMLSLLAGCTSHASRPDHLKETDDVDAFASMEETESETETEPKKRVALTFDDGPNHQNKTKVVVDELAKYGFHATFFVVGNRIAGGDSVQYAAEHGNEIGIHGYTHNVYYDSCSLEKYEEELRETAAAILRILPDYELKLMRPVGGRISSDRLQDCPYAVINWSVDSDDWNNKYYPGISDEEAEARVNRIVENVMSQVKDGDIILLHEIYESTVDATKIILQRLYEEGYEVVTVSELLGDDLEAGRLYHSKYD